MRLPPYYIDRAHRLYALSLQKNFVFGRRQAHIVVTVLYTVCRQEKSPHLLIDFSDVLQVNIYIIGRCFLQLIRILNLSLPVVDPSLYIHRYASRLNCNNKLNVISTTTLRIITRMKKDWIHTGRRPDGVCAAALLISTRIHGMDVQLVDIAELFRITPIVVKNRLQEFKNTPSAQLTVDQFHTHDYHVEQDPPKFISQMGESAMTNRTRVYYAFNTESDVVLGGGGQGEGGHGEDNTQEVLTNEESLTRRILVTVDSKGDYWQRGEIDGIEVNIPLPKPKVDANER